MYSIKIKGKENSGDPKMVKLDMIFFQNRIYQSSESSNHYRTMERLGGGISII